MKPIGPLMREHRLIEKMITLMGRQAQRFKDDGRADVIFIDRVVDFIRTYADRCHHGKEEDILFRELAHKNLPEEYEKIYHDLIEEHTRARAMVANLVSAREDYGQGNHAALQAIVDTIEALASFYPVHIEKEDTHFFYPVQEYFTPPEQAAMLEEFWEFDRKLIHEKYEKLLEEMK